MIRRTKAQVGRLHDEILEVAIHHFSKKGYLGTSIADIAQAVSITKSSFYHYFASKKSMGIAAIQRITEECVQHIFKFTEQLKAEPKIHLHDFMHAVISYVSRKPDAVSAIISCLSCADESGDEVRTVVAQHFQAWLEAFKRMYCFYYSAIRAEQFATKSLIYLQGTFVLIKALPPEQSKMLLYHLERDLVHLLNDNRIYAY